MFKYIAVAIAAMTVGITSVHAYESSHTYDGGKSWYSSDGSSLHTYDRGKSYYGNDGFNANTYDGGNSWYYSP